MSERVPEGWELSSLGDILSEKPSYGANASATNEDFANIRYIRITDINEYGQLRSDSTAFIKDKDAEGYKLKNDDLLVARTGNTVGKTYLHESSKHYTGTSFAYAGYLILLRFDSGKARPKYIFQYTLSKFFKDWVKENSRVGTQPNINAQEYSSFVLPLPPLPEQKKIASILTSVDEVIETTQKQIDKLQDLKKATMNELLTKGIAHTEFKDSELGRVPKSWEVATINSVTTFIKSGLSRRLSSQDIGIPVINSGNILSRGLDTKELKYWHLDDPQGANIENYLLQDGDILLNFINSVAQIGKSCIFKSLGRDCIYTTNLFCIRVGNKISSSFLHSLMSQERFKKEISLITKPAVNQASFTKEDLSNIIILLPTLEEQNFIMKSLEAIDENITNQHHKLETFQSLKKSLMQDLLTGKVRVQVN